MRVFQRRLIDWIEHRTGLESAVKNFLFEEIPASSGWHQVFGSVAVFLFLVQAFTGLLLAFNYAPTPGDAYNSLKYIVTELTGGALMRGLHHWGASMMIVVVVLHMTQVFVYGAYKKPREATWSVGIALLLLTLAYGLTGYLLPWDNRAYWGTVVTTQIASKAPLLGPYLTRLLGGEDSIGVVTFARFFALHVLLLPPVTTFLIAFHIYLVRKHGVTPAPGDSRPRKKFFPEQVFKDTVAIFVAFIILFVMAVVVKVPLERLADPTDTTYIPRPDWYFLFLFQILKFCEGPLEVVGSVVLPTMAILALLLVPFVDRGAAKRLAQRTVAFSAVALAAIGWTGLTVTAIVTTPKPTPGSAESGTAVAGWQQLSPEALAGIGYYRKEQCASCHHLMDGKTKVGPNLSTTPIKRSVGWMVEHFKNPAQMVPGTSMPPIHLSDAQLSALAAFLLTLTPRNATDLESVPDAVVEGAMIYQQQQCGLCHVVNGVGVQVGPSLNGVAGRHPNQWIEVQIRDPKRHSPETMMPGYNLSPREIDRLIEYLTAIPAK
ncbi:MAG: cytochrome b N-terminal domain-containing protein [Acidobacteria bacterium]|nr:cytochrome b N-terminal domain-containing protein [Acidobacteriota bacterium]